MIRWDWLHRWRHWRGTITAYIKKITYLGQILFCLKVRQSQNDFFKPMFLPKNKQSNSTSLLWNREVDMFPFVFWKKLKTSKRHFEITWTLVYEFRARLAASSYDKRINFSSFVEKYHYILSKIVNLNFVVKMMLNHRSMCPIEFRTSHSSKNLHWISQNEFFWLQCLLEWNGV